MSQSSPKMFFSVNDGTLLGFIFICVLNSEPYLTNIFYSPAQLYKDWELANRTIDPSWAPDIKAERESIVNTAKSSLKRDLFVYFKRVSVSDSSPFVPCHPGEELTLRMQYRCDDNFPNIGQATFLLSKRLTKREKQVVKKRRIQELKAQGKDQLDIDFEMDEDADEEDDDVYFGRRSPPPFVVARDAIPIPCRYPARPPINNAGRLPPPSEVSYAGYVATTPTTFILCANTRCVFSPPSSEPVTVFDDGYWGTKDPSLYPQEFDHHAPWLLYIPIAHEVLRRPLLHDNRQKLWTEGMRKSLMSLADEIVDELRKKRAELWSGVEFFCNDILNRRNLLNRDVEASDLPLSLFARELNLFYTLVFGVHSWKSFLLAMRAHERVMAELYAFLWWAQDVKSFPVPKANHRKRALRGSFFSPVDSDLFVAFAHMSAPVYLSTLEIPRRSSLMRLPFSRWRNKVGVESIVRFGKWLFFPSSSFTHITLTSR